MSREHTPQEKSAIVLDGLLDIIRRIDSVVLAASMSTHTMLPNTSKALSACHDLAVATLEAAGEEA